MNNKTFFIAVVALALVGAAGIIAYLPSRVDLALKNNVNKFPKSFGEWSGTDLPIDERTYEVLETRNLFVREYKNAKGNSVVLYVVYSEDNRKVSHPPEICLMGGGKTVIDKVLVPVTDTIVSNKLVTEKQGSKELFLYWFKAGKMFTPDYMKQQLKVVTNRLFGTRTTGAMIRVSTVLEKNNEDEGLNLLKAFCREIEPLLVEFTP